MKGSTAQLHDSMPEVIQLIDESDASLQIAKTALLACLDVKAHAPQLLDVRDQTDISDYFLIVSARSDRQAQGIANKAIDALQATGLKPVSVEGFETAHWILIDYGEVVVHVFYEPIREHYDLEGLWYKAKRLDVSHLSCAE